MKNFKRYTRVIVAGLILFCMSVLGSCVQPTDLSGPVDVKPLPTKPVHATDLSVSLEGYMRSESGNPQNDRHTSVARFIIDSSYTRVDTTNGVLWLAAWVISNDVSMAPGNNGFYMDTMYVKVDSFPCFPNGTNEPVSLGGSRHRLNFSVRHTWWHGSTLVTDSQTLSASTETFWTSARLNWIGDRFARTKHDRMELFYTFIIPMNMQTDTYTEKVTYQGQVSLKVAY